MSSCSQNSESKDLTVSRVDRQNLLNNQFAIQEIERAVHIKGISLGADLLSGNPVFNNLGVKGIPAYSQGLCHVADIA